MDIRNSVVEYSTDLNIATIQRFQSKVLCSIWYALWYLLNNVISKNLQISSVKEEITSVSQKYQVRLENHPNALVSDLFARLQVRILTRCDPMDLPQRRWVL